MKSVHKTVVKIANCDLATFSIGIGEQRRTVVCHREKLQIDLSKSSSLKSSEETEFSWRYVTRNSKPKYTTKPDNDVEHRSKKTMGIENADATTSHRPVNEKLELCYQADINSNSSCLTEDPSNSKKNPRTRRPERAFYVPRAKRSQTTPPSATASSSSGSSSKSQSKKSGKSKSVDESTSSCNSEESNDGEQSSSNNQKQLDGAVINTDPNLTNSESSTSCDLFDQNCSEDQKNQKNFNNLCTMSQQAEKDLIIGNDVSASGGIDKVDKDEKELMKASQEINRSNRKLIKQTFNSNVLEIESASGGASVEEKKDSQAVKEDDDWDTLFDDNGDCLDPKMVEEITKAVGKVNIEKPKQDYKAYHSNVDLLKDEQYPHVLECSNFPVEFRTQDLMALFAPYAKESNGFNIVWVDDTHCLVVFSSSKIAAEVLTANHPIVKMKPLAEATSESRTKARKCSSSLQPYRQRPETCAALAKRLVSGALGVRIKATNEERENERRLLREAKERKLQAAKAREEMWNN